MKRVDSRRAVERCFDEYKVTDLTVSVNKDNTEPIWRHTEMATVGRKLNGSCYLYAVRSL